MPQSSLSFLQILPPKISRSPHPKTHLKRSPPISPFPPINPIRAPTTFPPLLRPRLRFVGARCSSEEREPARAKDVVSDMVEELLRREENRGLLDGLEEASRRVELAREALADIERQESEALRSKEYVLQLENRRLEIEESQRELLEARAMVTEAKRSLSFNMDEGKTGDPSDKINEEINTDAERWESIKAASVSSVIGTLAASPISIYQATSFPQLVLHLTTIFFSCALFGVTFRYAIRRDLDNIQLKTGTSAAFGFVRGLAVLEAGKPLEYNSDSFISHFNDGAVSVLENIFIFLSAAIALDFCYKMRLFSPFPIRKQV